LFYGILYKNTNIFLGADKLPQVAHRPAIQLKKKYDFEIENGIVSARHFRI
jgi:hypothetical protein